MRRREFPGAPGLSPLARLAHDIRAFITQPAKATKSRQLAIGAVSTIAAPQTSSAR